jgi:uncharacterized membrane protein YoaK (UPF0700 family)
MGTGEIGNDGRQAGSLPSFNRQKTVLERVGPGYVWWYKFCYTGTCKPEECNCLAVLVMAIVMCFLSGWINGTAVVVYGVTVTHVTGSWTFIGVDISGDNVRPNKPIVEIVFFFAIGALISGLVTGEKRFSQKNRYGILLILESIFIFMGVVIWEETENDWAFPMFALGAGMQNALVTAYSGLIVRTTHLTGTWTDIPMIIGIALHHRIVGKKKSDKEWKLFVYFPEVFSFVFGAAAGGGVAHRIEILSMLVPGVIIFLIGVTGFAYELYYHGESYGRDMPDHFEREETHPQTQGVLNIASFTPNRDADGVV